VLERKRGEPISDSHKSAVRQPQTSAKYVDPFLIAVEGLVHYGLKGPSNLVSVPRT
jgi:hypothetical protein